MAHSLQLYLLITTLSVLGCGRTVAPVSPIDGGVVDQDLTATPMDSLDATGPNDGTLLDRGMLSTDTGSSSDVGPYSERRFLRGEECNELFPAEAVPMERVDEDEPRVQSGGIVPDGLYVLRRYVVFREQATPPPVRPVLRGLTLRVRGDQVDWAQISTTIPENITRQHISRTTGLRSMAAGTNAFVRRTCPADEASSLAFWGYHYDSGMLTFLGSSSGVGLYLEKVN